MAASAGDRVSATIPENTTEMAMVTANCLNKVPVMPGISSLSTAGSVELAQGAAEAGCGALMVLPPYVHNGKMHETRAHFAAIFTATDLPCMLYNNPIAYGTDVLPGAWMSMFAPPTATPGPNSRKRNG